MVAADASSLGGAVYCEVDGVASELPGEHLRQEGLFVPTPEPLAVDREVELFLRSPAGSIVLRGLVVQVIDCADAAAQGRSPGYGVLFLDLKDEQRAWITQTRAALQPPRRSIAQPAAPAVAAPAKTTPRIEDAVERARSARKVGTATLRTNTLTQLEAELASLKSRSPSELLGLAAPQDVEGAHRAFLVLSKRYHPHVYARYDSAEITRLATEIFIVYKRAYATIRSGGKDGGAQRSVGSERPPAMSQAAPAAQRSASTPPPPTSLRAPPTSLRAPSSSLRAGAPRASLSPSADPMARRIADAELLLASGLRHLAASRFDRAEVDLVKAARLAPERIDMVIWLHVGCARTHKAGGRAEEAAASYRKVLELDPQHREAREHLDPPAERRRGGLMSKWLGRGED